MAPRLISNNKVALQRVARIMLLAYNARPRLILNLLIFQQKLTYTCPKC